VSRATIEAVGIIITKLIYPSLEETETKVVIEVLFCESYPGEFRNARLGS